MKYLSRIHYAMIPLILISLIAKFSNYDLNQHFQHNHNYSGMSWFGFILSCLSLFIFSAAPYAKKLITIGVAISFISFVFSVASFFIEFDFITQRLIPSAFYLFFYSYNYFTYTHEKSIVKIACNLLMITIVSTVLLCHIFYIPALTRLLIEDPQFGATPFGLLACSILLVKSWIYKPKFLTVCAWSKKVKFNDKWMEPVDYLSQHYQISHGISPEEKIKFLKSIDS